MLQHRIMMFIRMVLFCDKQQSSNRCLTPSSRNVNCSTWNTYKYTSCFTGNIAIYHSTHPMSTLLRELIDHILSIGIFYQSYWIQCVTICYRWESMRNAQESNSLDIPSQLCIREVRALRIMGIMLNAPVYESCYHTPLRLSTNILFMPTISIIVIYN